MNKDEFYKFWLGDDYTERDKWQALISLIVVIIMFILMFTI